MAERASIYLTKVRAYLAQCTAFRTWTGAADATAAEAFVFFDELSAEEEAEAGRYVLLDLVKVERGRAGGAFRGGFETRGCMVFMYFYDVPTGDDAESTRAARGFIEDVVDDIMFGLESTVPTGDALSLVNWEAGPGARSDEKTDDFVWREVLAEFM